MRGMTIDTLKNSLLIAGLLIAFGIVGRMDYEDALRAEAEAAQQQATLHRDALLTCLNGGAPGLFTTDSKGHRHYLVCSAPYEVSDENTGNRG